MDIVEFLTARLDEDEHLAETASPGPWRPSAEHYEVLAVDDEVVCDGFALSNRLRLATVDHIVRHDPARVLADVAAKRAILADHRPVPAVHGRTGNHCCQMCGSGDSEYPVWWPCSTIRALIQPFADHPDFDPAWTA